MKHLLIIVMLTMAPTYRPDSIIPRYYVSKTPQGKYKVYDARQIVVPKYYVKPTPEGYEVYKVGKPLFLLYRIESKGGQWQIEER